MADINSTIFGCGRYIQQPGALSLVGAEASFYGKRVFVIGGKTALSVSWAAIENSLKQNGIAYELRPFSGECCIETIDRYVKEAKEFNAAVIIGVGGGRVMDTSKAVANVGGFTVITVPTSTATCAASSAYPVIYTQDGNYSFVMKMEREVSAVIVDTEIIAKHCPSRMLATGVVDSLAKYIELTYNVNFRADWKSTVTGNACFSLSKSLYDTLMEKAENAVAAVERKELTPDVEDVVFSVVAITSIISCVARCAGQVAHAHAFYYAVCKYYGYLRAKYMHGEIVGIALPFQLAVCGISRDKIAELKIMLKNMGVPSGLSDIGLEATEENCERIVSFLCENTGIVGDEHFELLKRNFEVFV